MTVIVLPPGNRTLRCDLILSDPSAPLGAQTKMIWSTFVSIPADFTDDQAQEEIRRRLSNTASLEARRAT